MKKYHIDIVFGHTPIKGTITETGDSHQTELPLTEKRALPETEEGGFGMWSEKQYFILQKCGLSDEKILQLTRDEGVKLIAEEKERYLNESKKGNSRTIPERKTGGNPDPLPWEGNK